MLCRYEKYMDMACKGMICPEKLPPTTRAAYFHGLRAHHQIMVWSQLNETNQFDPITWGWLLEQNMMVPKKTDADIAP